MDDINNNGSIEKNNSRKVGSNSSNPQQSATSAGNPESDILGLRNRQTTVSQNPSPSDVKSDDADKKDDKKKKPRHHVWAISDAHSERMFNRVKKKIPTRHSGAAAEIIKRQIGSLSPPFYHIKEDLSMLTFEHLPFQLTDEQMEIVQSRFRHTNIPVHCRTIAKCETFEALLATVDALSKFVDMAKAQKALKEECL